MALHGTRAPGQRHAGFDRRIVLTEPAGKAPHRLQGTRGRAIQPGVELRRLPLAHEDGKVLREVNRLGHLGRLRVELGELLRLSLGALGLTPEYQPGRPAGRPSPPCAPSRRQGMRKGCTVWADIVYGEQQSLAAGARPP